MPVIPAVLEALIAKKVSDKMKKLSGTNPLQQKDPSYFIEMCRSISLGIALGTPVINFSTVDSGVAGSPPIPAPGTGTGIVVDDKHMSELIYKLSRDNVIKEFKETNSDPWPPRKGNSGEYLKALTDGVSESIKEHFKTAWVLTSVHQPIYSGTGKINPGKFTGISADLVKSSIISSSPKMKGDFWPKVAEAIAKGYAESIQKKATGTVSITGVCVPSPGQVCGLPIPGNGSGVAA